MKYIAKGLVLGNYWGGGKGSYPTKKLENDDKDELLKEAVNKLEDGSLDSGMGYESLIGAILNIEEIDTKIIDGKEYSRSEFSIESIGILTEEQFDFLEEQLFGLNTR